MSCKNVGDTDRYCFVSKRVCIIDMLDEQYVYVTMDIALL